MRLLRFIPIQLTLFLLLGIILGNAFDFGTIFPILSTILLILVLGFLFYMDFGNRKPLFPIITALLTLSIGVLAISLSNPKNLPNHYTNTIADGSQTFHRCPKLFLKLLCDCALCSILCLKSLVVPPVPNVSVSSYSINCTTCQKECQQ